MTEAERKLIEKKIQGLIAKLNWDHLEEPVKVRYQAMVEELKGKLKVND